MKKFLCLVLCVVLALSNVALPVCSAEIGTEQGEPVLYETKSQEQKLSITDIAVNGTFEFYENTNGREEPYYENGEYIGSYFRYNPEYAINSITITYSDSSGETVLMEDAKGVKLDYNQDYYNQWTAGNAYEVALTYKGITRVFSVDILENSMVSISANNVKKYEAFREGRWETYLKEDGTKVDYYYYDVERIFESIDFVNADESIGSIPLEAVHGEQYEYVQDGEHIWTAGNSYPVTLSYGGLSCVYYVIIEPNEITEITNVKTKTVFEKMGGRWVSEYNESGELVEYYYYDLISVLDTVSYRNNKGLGALKDVEYLDREDIRVESEQSADNQFVAGNTYPATFWYGGVSYEFYVEIRESVVASIDEPKYVQIKEFTCGEWKYWFDDEGNYCEQFIYEPLDIIEQYKLCLKRGFDMYLSPRALEEGAVLTADQETPWVAGGKYTIVLDYMGLRFETEVEILGEKVESYEVSKTVPLVYGVHSISKSEENQNGEYVSYNYFDAREAVHEITIHYKDGTSEVLNRNMITIFEPAVSDQSPDNEWQVGNTYSASIKYEGFEIDFNVEIVEPSLYNFFYTANGIEIKGLANRKHSSYTEDLVVPAEIYGVPVAVIHSIGRRTLEVSSITIPDSVKFIHPGAFAELYENKDLVVNLGAGINKMDPSTFHGLERVVEINVSKDNPYFTSIDGVVYDKNVTKLIAYPVAKGDYYKLPATVVDMEYASNYPKVTFEIGSLEDMYDIENGVYYNKGKTALLFAEPTVSGKVVIPDTVTEISEGAFRNCVGLESVVVSSKVTQIAYAAFDGCTGLKSVTLPSSVQSIGEYAFNNCQSLTSVNLSEGLEYIGEKAFLNSGVKRLSLPDSVESISEYAFAYSDLEVFTAGSGLKTIGVGAFNECRDLKYAALNEGLESIGYDAFRACVSLEQIVIPDSVTEIGVCAFQESGIKYLTIGSGITTLPANCFMGCTLLEGVMVPENVVIIESGVFSDCRSLKAVDIRGDIADFGPSVFKGCYALDRVQLYKGQSVITAGEFYDCDGLEDILLPADVEKIEFNAFAQCDNLEVIFYGGTKEQWDNIVIEEGNEAISNCEIMYGASVGYDEYVVVTVNGLPELLRKSSEFRITAAKVEYNKLDGKAYVFDGWVVHGDTDYTVEGHTIMLSHLFEDIVIETNTFIHGNVNGDEGGKVTAADMLALLDGIKNSAESEAYDVNLDGKITAADKLALMQVIKGTFDYSQF